MEIISPIIVACISAVVTLVTSHSDRKENRMHASRESILQLILEDKVNVDHGKIPENKENILHEYDEYRQNGGNSYIVEKVKDYLIWYEETVKSLRKETNEK